MASRADVHPNGLIVTYMDVGVSPRASGVVEAVFVQEGQWVAAGDTLGELDSAKERMDMQVSDLELEELQISLEKTKKGKQPKEIEKMAVDVKKAELSREKAKAELDRTKKLFGQKAVSDKDVADAQNAYEVAVLSVESLKLSLDLAKAEPRMEDVLLQEMKITQKMTAQDQKKMALEKMTIFSPNDGVISKLYYSPGEFASSGSPFCDILYTDSLYVELNLPVSDIKEIRLGQKATVTVPTLTSNTYPGRVVFIGPTVDPASRTFKIRVEIANPKRILKPGLFATVSF